jgi:hypothetical protein
MRRPTIAFWLSSLCIWLALGVFPTTFAAPSVDPSNQHSVVTLRTTSLTTSHDALVPLSSYASPELTRELANKAQVLRLREVELYNLNFEADQIQRQLLLARWKAEDEFNLRLLNRQLFYHPIILFVVLFLVLSSTVLVVIQFISWSRKSNSAESTFEIGKDGLKVKSPFIGLLMLVASYGFFYLYILEVYRIHPSATSGSPKITEVPSKQ